MIACYKQNIHLLPFADVFLRSLFVFAGGGDSSIGHYGLGGGGVGGGGRLLNWSLSKVLLPVNNVLKKNRM